MHGLINRGLQCFVRDIYGPDKWDETRSLAEIKFANFETMLSYNDADTENMIDAISSIMQRDRSDILEDFGTYVVSEASLSTIPRLLRFGGDTFVEFLHSLEDVHDRSKIALPDLDVPQFELEEHSEEQFTLSLRFDKLGFGAVFLGLLRAMADDYGVLVMIDHIPQRTGDLDTDKYEIMVHQLDLDDEEPKPETKPNVVH